MISGTVTEDDIAEIVADWTGIPVTRLNEDEAARLLIWKINCMKGL